MRGDIKANELYKDREFLLRVGYGIYDIPVGEDGVGFEDVLKFSYVENQEEDEKLYRRKVFDLTGNYYPNQLAKALWGRFVDYQARLVSEQNQSVTLQEAANQWLGHFGHDFFKQWALEQEQVPFRMRNREELRLGWLDLAIGRFAPQWRELIQAGFSLPAIGLAAWLEGFKSRPHQYLRIVARLSGHAVQDQPELAKRCYEVEQLAEYLSRQTGQPVDLKAATIEYYRRLSLIAEIEGKHQPLELGGALSATACA